MRSERDLSASCLPIEPLGGLEVSVPDSNNEFHSNDNGALFRDYDLGWAGKGLFCLILPRKLLEESLPYLLRNLSFFCRQKVL